MIRDLACVAPVLAEKLAKMLNERLVCGVIFRSAWEQSPTLSNAVTLNNSFDKFGIPRVSLKWKKIYWIVKQLISLYSYLIIGSWKKT